MKGDAVGRTMCFQARDGEVFGRGGTVHEAVVWSGVVRQVRGREAVV